MKSPRVKHHRSRMTPPERRELQKSFIYFRDRYLRKHKTGFQPRSRKAIAFHIPADEH